MVLLESRDLSRYYRGIFVAHRDRAGEEGDLATRRTISAKVCYSMVSSTLKINAILPNPNAFATNRKTIRRRYPFVFFLSIGVVPITSWIWTTELTVWFWAFYLWEKVTKAGSVSVEDIPDAWINDTNISPSFGQVCLPVSYVELTQISRLFDQILALFIAVPPFLQVCQLVPQLWPWFINLTWVACCWKRKRGAKRSASMEKLGLSYETVDYTQLENPELSGVRNSWKEGKKSRSQKSV